MLRKVLVVCSLTLGTLAWSQNVKTTFEIFGGYTYTPTNFAWSGAGESGWDASFDANAGRWFGLKADISQYFAPVPFTNVHIKTTAFLFGPQVSIPLPTASKIRPFGQFLIGGVHEPYVNSFAWDFGGGMDFRLSRHLWLRAEGDYMHSHLILGDNQQQPFVPRWHARVTTGLVFRF